MCDLETITPERLQVATGGDATPRSGPATFKNNTSGPCFVSTDYKGPAPLSPWQSIAVPAGVNLRAQALDTHGNPAYEFRTNNVRPGRQYNFLLGHSLRH
jgi:hypothetical protein